jgi:hypothetical protein
LIAASQLPNFDAMRQKPPLRNLHAFCDAINANATGSQRSG